VSFAKNAKVMLVGFALAQALPLLASPLLTRLFSAEAFGLQTLFVSWATVLGVLATLRLDLAIVLARDRREAGQIVALAALQTLFVTVVVFALAATLGGAIAGSTGHPDHVAWVWALIPMLVAMSATQTCSGALTWLKLFGPASQMQVVNQLSYLAVAIGVGLWASPTEGLVGAKLVGQAAAGLGMLLVVRGLLTEMRLPTRSDWTSLWSRCRPFIMFNTPYSLIGTLGREVPIFAFSAVASTATAGFYGLARTMLGAPATLLAASLSQVFYREAVEHRGTNHLQVLTTGLLRVTMGATAPAFAFILIWGDAAFALAFGSGWETAGRYAMILSIAAWLGIQTAWPERLYESVGRQATSFAIQISFDAITALIVFASVLSGLPHIVTVALFATVNSLFHITYLAGMFHVAAFPIALLSRAIAGGVLVMAASVAVMAILRFSGLPLPVGLACGAALAGLTCAGLGFLGYRSLGPIMSGSR